MQNKSKNMQFEPNIILKSKYCPLSLQPDFPICIMEEDIWYFSSDPITMVHFHNCIQIGYCSNGDGYSYINNALYPYSHDYISIIPAKIQHHFSSNVNAHSSWKWLYLEPVTMLPDLTPDMGRQLMRILYDGKHSIPYMIGADTEPGIISVTRSIILEMEKKKRGYKEIVRSYVYILMLMLLRMVNQWERYVIEPRTNLQLIGPALQYITQYYMEQLTIGQLAAMCHISVTHFRRLFLKIMNYSPLDYIQMVRLEAACVLLLRTDESVLNIGSRCGFSSDTSFNRQFRKHFDTTPGRWRREIQCMKKPEEQRDAVSDTDM